MKFWTTLLFAALAGVGIYALRRRLILALRVGAITYAILLPLRLVFTAGSMLDRLDELVWPAVILLLVWVVLWWVSTRYERRARARR